MKNINNIVLSLVLAAALAGCWSKKHHKNHKNHDNKTTLDATDTDNSAAEEEKKMPEASKPANTAQTASGEMLAMGDAANTDAATADGETNALETDKTAELPKGNKAAATKNTAAITQALLDLTDAERKGPKTAAFNSMPDVDVF